MQTLFAVGCGVAYLALGLIAVFLGNRFNKAWNSEAERDPSLNGLMLLFWPLFAVFAVFFYCVCRPIWSLVKFADQAARS